MKVKNKEILSSANIPNVTQNNKPPYIENIPYLKQNMGKTADYDFVYITEDNKQLRDVDYVDNKIFIGKPETKKFNLGSLMLQSLGIYEEDFKPYLFSTLVNGAVGNMGQKLGAGSLVNSVLYDWPLDRSYISQAGFPRFLNYTNGKFWGGKIEPYFEIKINNPRGTMNALYQYGKSLDNNFGNLLSVPQKIENKIQSFYDGAAQSLYSQSNRTTLMVNKEDGEYTIPTFGSLLSRQPRTALQKLIPFSLNKYTIEQFNKDYKELMDSLSITNSGFVIDRETQVANNLDRFNLDKVEPTTQIPYPNLDYPLMTAAEYSDGGDFRTIYIPVFKDTLKINRDDDVDITSFNSKFANLQVQLDDINNVIVENRKKQFITNMVRFNQPYDMVGYSQSPLLASVNNQLAFDKNYKQYSKSANTVTLWKGISGSQYVIDDTLAYLAQSYKTGVTNNVDKNDGDIIKFWIQDVNNNRYITTPAFISNLKDGGLEGQWQQVAYAGGMYPRFSYKGTSKRTISFDLKLACFDKKYLPQYVQKLNFFRTVGLPTYRDVSVVTPVVASVVDSGPTYDEVDNTTDLTKTIGTFKLPKAPIYKLTLGDIVRQQYGFFQSCQLSWPDDSSIWNLDKKKTYRQSGNADFWEKNIKDSPDEIQIPIMTQISITFVCMLGSGYENGYKIYDNIKWRNGLQ